jgi:DNA polymerase family B
LEGFAERFRQKYDIGLEIKNKYDELLLGKKKHYIGLENGVIDSVGFEGEKSDRCDFFHTVYNQLLNDIFVKRTNPLPNVRKAFSDLASGNVNSKFLTISIKVGQEPDDYVVSARVGRIAKAAGANKGDLIKFYSGNKKKMGKSWTLDPTELDISDYRQKLWNTLEEILDIAGHPVGELRQEFGVKPKPEKAKSTKRKAEKNRGEQILENYSIVSNNLNSTGGGK